MAQVDLRTITAAIRKMHQDGFCSLSDAEFFADHLAFDLKVADPPFDRDGFMRDCGLTALLRAEAVALSEEA